MKLKSDREISSFQTFSMSVATLERIDNILTELHSNWIMGNVLLIQRLLFSLYKELHPFLNDKEKRIGDKKIIEITDNMGFDEATNSFMYSSGISINLNGLDFWLRDKLHEKGLLISKPDVPDFAIAQT